MPINAHPDFLAAEREYLSAETKDKKITALKKMISLAPSHKGAENLRAQLKKRLAKLKYTNEKIAKNSSSSRKKGIKKESMQAAIVGFTDSGKSSLLSILTNANPKISEENSFIFTTKSPEVGMMNFENVQIQIVEVPAINSEFYDKSIANTADVLLILADKIKDFSEVNNLI